MSEFGSYKNWPIVRNLLLKNRLEHAALLAYGLGSSEVAFVARARMAWRGVELKVATQLEMMAELAEKEDEDEPANETPKAEQPPPPTEPPPENKP